jgi:peptide/nickel transport system substrate-binding protein
MARKKRVVENSAPVGTEAEGESLKDKLTDTKRVRARYRRWERVSITHIYKFVIMRWRNLTRVREHMAGWLVIVLLLLTSVVAQGILTNGAVMERAGVEGGIYSEGVVGTISNLNPIFAENDNEKALSRLMYLGLFTYDKDGVLQMDLLDKYTVSADNKNYEFTLGSEAKWSDGREITTDDVVFTMGAIGDAALASPYRKSFAKVAVEKVDEKRFKARTSLPQGAFLDLLTMGILPKHQLAEVGSLNMRDFYNQEVAVVSGPYQYAGKTAVNDANATISFSVNRGYGRAAALIPSIEVHTYEDSASLRRAILNGEVNAAVGMNKDDIEGVVGHPNLRLVQETLHDGVMALFNTTNLDLRLRQALRLAVDREAVRTAAAVNEVMPMALEGPTFGEFTVKQPARDTAGAVRILEEAGWTIGKSGVRSSAEGQKLEVSMVTAAGTNYAGAAEILAQNWREIGVEVEVTYVDSKQLQASYMVPRSYDVLLAQLKFGANDDFSAYWHSSGASPVGTNYANYRSSVADFAINAAQVARTEEERTARRDEFLRQWVADAPAVALYSPMFYYVADSGVETLAERSIVDSGWRFAGVTGWTVWQGVVFRTL